MAATGNSNTPVQPAAAKSPSSLRMILTMGGIGLAAGFLIVMTYQATFSRIESNKAAALERAIFEVVPGAASKVTFAERGDRLEKLEAGTDAVSKYYACYDNDGALVGVAIQASGQGFQDVVRLIYGYSPGCHCVVGMKVLESKETPGLGDKIMKDPAFKANFEKLDAALDAGGDAIDHPITLVKKGEKTDPWQIEAITGATISSRAVTAIIRESTDKAVPVIEANIDAMTGETQ